MDDLCFRPAKDDGPTEFGMDYHERQSVCLLMNLKNPKDTYFHYFRVILLEVVRASLTRVLTGGLFRRISKFPTLRSALARSNKEVRLSAVSWAEGVLSVR